MKNKITLLISIIVLLIGGYFRLFYLPKQREKALNGVNIQGLIFKIKYKTAWAQFELKDGKYLASYKFANYTRSSNYSVGDTVTIKYELSNPSNNVILIGSYEKYKTH